MDQPKAAVKFTGQEHWTKKGDIKLFLWHKPAAAGPARGTLLFVHGRPGTRRSKVGCEAIDEPCTKRSVPLGDSPEGGDFCQRNSLTSSFRVQCSAPLTRVLSSMAVM